MSRIIETVTHYQDKEACKSGDEMEQLCCEPTGALQCCKKVVPEWDGYSAEEILDHLGIVLDDQGRDSQGRYVNIEFAARIKPCGEQVTTYDLSGNNCCDEVEPLVWDAENSAEVIADNSSAVVVVTGGNPDLTVKLRGVGFFLDGRRTRRSGSVTGPSITIYTGDACGACHIIVSDGCSSVSGNLRSNNGQWQLVYSGGGGAGGFGGCPVEFAGVATGSAEAAQFTEISGIYKIEQGFKRWEDYTSAARRPYSAAMAACSLAFDNKPPVLTDEFLTGACFHFVPGCEGCAGCSTVSDGAALFSFNPGFHSSVSSDCTATEGWCWAVSGWSFITDTIIWEWQC